MARPGQIDHILQGIAALPELYRQDPQVKYLSVYLAQFNEAEEIEQELLDALLGWFRTTPVFSFVYDLIGGVLDTLRPDGFDDAGYQFVLLARTRVRKSSNVLDDVLRVAQFLAKGQTFVVQPIVPRAYVIAFFDLGLSDQEKQLYRDMLLDTIGQVDQLVLQFVTTGTAQYDNPETVYDQATYA